jgi:ABC-2 type transport system permease protein
MKLHRIEAVIIRHVYEVRHNLDRVTDTIYWPVMDIVVWGFFTIYLSRGNHLRPGLISFLLGAVILWGFFRTFQKDITVGFLAEVWSGNLVNLFATPLTVSEYMVGLIAINFLKATIGMAAAGLIAWLSYAYNILPVLPALLPFTFNLIIFAIAAGIVTSALVLRYTTRIQSLTYSFTGILMPFSCVFYPLSALPGYLRPIALLLPTMHSFEGMRSTIAGDGFSISHFAWGLSLNVGYTILAIMFFRRMFESARSRGLLVKLE